MRDMRNLKVLISYKGTAYHGFQRQTNAITIQEVLETAVEKLLKTKHSVIGCSRTDAGVHAREFCFNMKTMSAIPTVGFVKGLNALLPHDIAVKSCNEAEVDFHARYSAKSKEYSYLIHTGEIRDVFRGDSAFFYPRSLDVKTMNEVAELFIGEHNFSAYCKAESLEIVKSKKRGTVREIYSFNVQKYGDYIEMSVSGNGFLHNMVRIMAGTLVYVSEGKRCLYDVRESLLTGERELAGITLPPQGLYLNRVEY